MVDLVAGVEGFVDVAHIAIVESCVLGSLTGCINRFTESVDRS